MGGIEIDYGAPSGDRPTKVPLGPTLGPGGLSTRW